VVTEGRLRPDERFNMTAVSPSGEYVALMARIGTKGVILRHDGTLVRELNRHSYRADAYGYPLTFARLSDGREVVIHCPEVYCQLEIEDIVTGERIQAGAPRKPPDIFHSGLAVSPGGRWLLSAGWAWTPFHLVKFYDLDAASRDSSVLDRSSPTAPGIWEMGSAAFVDEATVMIGTLDEFFGDEGDPLQDRPGKHSVALWRIGSDSYARTIHLTHPPGALMPVGNDFVVTFDERPRLYDLRSGALAAEWSIDSGRQAGAITWHHLPPPFALQPARARFAVATATDIHVVEIDRTALG
jgi:hypothetical protein